MKKDAASFAFLPLESSRLAFLEKRFDEAETNQPSLKMLRDRLLGLRGAMIVAPRTYDADLDLLLERGTLFDATTAAVVGGRASDCHANVSRMWIMHAEANEAKSITIVTGYALSEDGLWRQHSWALDTEGVVETTELRLLYFGVALGPEHAARFAAANT